MLRTPTRPSLSRPASLSGKLSFQIIDATNHVSLPARLYFGYADGREEEPVVGRFKNFIVTPSGREVKTIPTGEYDVYITRGTEYSLNHHKISILEGKTTHIDFAASSRGGHVGLHLVGFSSPSSVRNARRGDGIGR